MAWKDGSTPVARFWKLTPSVALVAIVLLLAASVVVTWSTERAYRAQKVQEVSVQARILASTVTAALTFDDRKAAQDYVNALQANDEIRAAAIYDEDAALFASFARDAEQVPAQFSGRKTSHFDGSQLIVVEPVIQEGAPIGTVYLRSSVEPLAQRLGRYAGVVLLMIMAAVVVGVLGTAHRALARAHNEMEHRAAELAEANQRLQVQMEERAKIEEALRQAQKMESIGQLTGGVAHDFNNLLTIILGNIERLRRWLAESGNPKMIRAADHAIEGAQRAATLTRSLLAFSRRQPLNPKPLDLNKMVTSLSDLLRRTLGEQITIESVVAGGLWRTQVDPNQLENAILNLAVNARDAMPDGGKLTIETANAYLDARYIAEHADVAPGQYVLLSVSDTGAGMSKEVLRKAFEPFFTTKDIGRGTGLGLSQVYGFVKQSGGHVKIYSEVGQGTTVKIYLPRLNAEVAAPDAPPKAERVPVGDGSEVVLVVEDEDGVRAHSVALLQELGYRVLEAATGSAALEALDKHADIALLFTDVGLPGGMNGRQLADEACRRHRGLKVLFTTGYARNAIVHDGRLDPGVHLLTKPFTRGELATAVRQALDRHSGTPCILVVDDEAMVRMNTVSMLEELGVDVLEAGTAAQALEQIHAAGDRIHAVILDIGLPDRKGDALAADLRERHKDMRIIIASGYSEQALSGGLSSDAFVRFLAKPYGPAQLAAVLRSVAVPLPRKSP